MPRSCHPMTVRVKIRNGEARVCIYGKCPKCGTGSGYLTVPSSEVNWYKNVDKEVCVIIDGYTVTTTCALETCEHTYSVHT